VFGSEAVSVFSAERCWLGFLAAFISASGIAQNKAMLAKIKTVIALARPAIAKEDLFFIKEMG
jgi:hypothetical protein